MSQSDPVELTAASSVHVLGLGGMHATDLYNSSFPDQNRRTKRNRFVSLAATSFID